VITGEVSSKGGRIHGAGQPIQVAENFLTKLGHFHSANIEIYTWTSSQNIIIYYSTKLSSFFANVGQQRKNQLNNRSDKNHMQHFPSTILSTEKRLFQMPIFLIT
jgi:hypothetical protein